MMDEALPEYVLLERRSSKPVQSSPVLTCPVRLCQDRACQEGSLSGWIFGGEGVTCVLLLEAENREVVAACQR